MMEVEADARGFYHAAKKAFVSDGLPYNWVIQQRHFGDFTPILDFVHAVEHLYEAARSVHDDAGAALGGLSPLGRRLLGRQRSPGDRRTSRTSAAGWLAPEGL